MRIHSRFVIVDIPSRCNRVTGRIFVFPVLSLLVFILTIVSSLALAQGTATRYVYDNNGRLRAVIAPSGEANIYEYDLAGNITAIRRNTATTLEVLDFSPREGVPGTQVKIVGTGFGAGVNSVDFNGEAAQMVSATGPVVVATVPANATTGPITVTTPQGNATTAQSFVVKGMQLTPLSASLNPGQTLQFTATVYPPGGNPDVKWTVNGFEGGNASAGTITVAGLYTSPNFPFLPATIRATSVADPAIFEEARVTLFSPPPVSAPSAAMVSVGRAQVTTTVTAMPSAGVSTTKGPYISAISPGSLGVNTTTTVTITGANLTGATGLVFIDSGGVSDASISATNITVDVGGASLTASVTVGSGAVTGPHLLIVTTPTIRSLSVGTGTNLIQIVP